VIPVWAQLGYLLAAVCFVLALKGLASPRTARWGNLVGALGAAVALGVVFGAGRPDNVVPIVAAMLVGAAAGIVAARRVVMTAMPQMVAVFNGLGGAAGGLVALLEFTGPNADGPWYVRLATAFTILVGSVAFTGSMLTFAKLQELMTGRPVVFPGLPWAFGLALTVTLLGGAWMVAEPGLAPALVVAAAALLIGVILVLPVGGADVPIVISLLNAFSGLTVAAGGYVLENALLLVAGTLVGASGSILTRLMAKAMGRSVVNILFGALRGGSTLGADTVSVRPVRSAGPDDIAIQLGYARKVVVVPGYGLAVAQAQHTVHELATLLESRGVEVSYAIHPVAGRMPGHMNVLLAEANVPYEQLLEMAAANPELHTADVALVVGANDVVNPAARNVVGSPIYGMPILDVDRAQGVVFLKRSMRPGFAGIENELLYDPRTTLLFGDAKESLTKLVSAVKNL
jgi:NAD(P) transhydrogenase subunit beta